MKTKICSKCKIEKFTDEFTKHPTTKDGLQCRCKSCRKIDKQEYYKSNKNKIAIKLKKYREGNKEKLIEYARNYYRDNKVKLLEDKKKYYKKNSIIIYKKLLNYNQKNKEKVNSYKNEYNKKKKKSCNLYRLKILMRDRVNKFFKYSSLNKSSQTFDMIGCLPIELKEHLEKQFKEGMSWDNYGIYGWHIDHIIPLSSAKTEEELIRLCHHTNLQPLWAKDNLSKGSKISNR